MQISTNTVASICVDPAGFQEVPSSWPPGQWQVKQPSSRQRTSAMTQSGAAATYCRPEIPAISSIGRYLQGFQQDLTQLRENADESKYPPAWREFVADVAALRPQQSERLQRLVRLGEVMVPAAPLPAAATGEDGVLVVEWRGGQRLLSFEIFADGTFEWFYVDHATDDASGCDRPETVLAVTILAKYLALVIP